MDSTLSHFFELLLKTNDYIKGLSCQLNSCMKLLNNERYQNKILRRQYISLTQNTSLNLRKPFHLANPLSKTKSPAKDDAFQNEKTVRLHHTITSKHYSSREEEIFLNAPGRKPIDNVDKLNNLLVTKDVFSAVIIESGAISSCNGEGVGPSAKLEIKLLGRVYKSQNSRRFQCHLCRENFGRTKTFHNHTNYFHNVIDPNDSCTKVFLSSMTPNTSLKSIPHANPSILTD